MEDLGQGCAPPVFWTGILYDNDIINIVWDHVKK